MFYTRGSTVTDTTLDEELAVYSLLPHKLGLCEASNINL